nr:hypothetical protein [uncultured Celeribacter sp.]
MANKLYMFLLDATTGRKIAKHKPGMRCGVIAFAVADAHGAAQARVSFTLKATGWQKATFKEGKAIAPGSVQGMKDLVMKEAAEKALKTGIGFAVYTNAAKSVTPSN